MKTIALAGNPNCGKTSLFNELTKAKQHVGNWPGVTVEKKEGILKYEGKEYTVVDQDGNIVQDWANYTGPININKNNVNKW